jgi:two-component system, chemotaxis family, chemotaxis protein CheY
MHTILLVEDDDDIREVFAEVLREDGYDVREAENGKVALEQLAHMRGTPCLVLLDLMMPVMSGSELLKVLHDTHQLASLPVVVLSAGGSSSDAPEARQFLRKPVHPDVLLKVVNDFCGPP